MFPAADIFQVCVSSFPPKIVNFTSFILALKKEQIEGGKVEAVTAFIFLVSKVTVDGDCNCEIKRCSLLGRKIMTNLHSILRSRDITLPTKVHIVKAMVFPVVMYEYNSLSLKKAEH